MLEWSDGPTVWSCSDRETLRGRWEGMLLRRKWQNKVLPAFHPIYHSVTPLQFHLSLPLPSVSFSIELVLTIELGSVSAIEWLKLMTHYLPL